MLAYGLLFASKCDGIQLKEENVSVDSIMGHGGLFKTPVVGQRILAAALNAPVTVMETAGEGGPWGMAVLAAYMLEHGEESLADYLDNRIFAGQRGSTVDPVKEDVEGFDAFVATYKATLPAQNAAVEAMKVRRNA